MFDKGPLHWSLSQSLILKINFDGIGSTWPCLVWSKSNMHPCTLHIASTIFQNPMSSSFFSKRRTFTLPGWSFHLKSSFWSDHISHWRQKIQKANSQFILFLSFENWTNIISIKTFLSFSQDDLPPSGLANPQSSLRQKTWGQHHLGYHDIFDVFLSDSLQS